LGSAGIQEHLERIKKGVTFHDCVRLARLDFEEQFSNILKQLLFNFPADAKTRDGGMFWAPPKVLFVLFVCFFIHLAFSALRCLKRLM
jgi:hypothetical protein